MENFFKTLEAIGEACASFADEQNRNADQGRPRSEITHDAYSQGYQVPRPSAPDFAAETIAEKFSRAPSVSSGYASGSSSRNSTRRNSEASIDEEFSEDDTRIVTSTRSSAAASPRSPPPDPSLDPVGALFGALAIGALGVGAYYAGKHLLANKKLPIETFSACETALKEIKEFVQLNCLMNLHQIFIISETRSNILSLDSIVNGYNGVGSDRLWHFFNCRHTTVALP